jgi:hypothetical protein
LELGEANRISHLVVATGMARDIEQGLEGAALRSGPTSSKSQLGAAVKVTADELLTGWAEGVTIIVEVHSLDASPFARTIFQVVEQSA